MMDMLLAALFVTALAPVQEIRVLFLGNSHTAVHDVPAQVKALVESDKVKVLTHMITAGFIDDLDRPDVRKSISSGRWDYVVIQAVKLSSSHQYRYPIEAGINLAKLARASGSKALLFAEWPRRGWDESGYIMGVYQRVAEASGATIVPVPYAWDKALKKQPTLELWGPDGNHSSPTGAYLAACTISGFLSTRLSDWRPNGMTGELAAMLQRIGLSFAGAGVVSL